MKTIKKKGKEPQRVFDIVAENMVKNQGWSYCPKSEWREKVRDAKPVETKKNIKKKNERKRKTRA
tara:strand:- start:846 stop:1040 length:195 start_codon:yes stop_codon:yes gene_type:complete